MAINEVTIQPTVGLTKEDVQVTVLDLDIRQQTTKRVASAPPARIPPLTTRATLNSPNIQHYLERSADVSAYATVDHPLGILFDNERSTTTIPNPDDTTTTTTTTTTPQTPLSRLPTYRPFCLQRLTSKIEQGSFILESGDFAATACWTPASCTPPPPTPSFFTDLATKQGRPLFSRFLADIEAARERHLYPTSRKYWQLSLMARDPRCAYVPGAVRAVLEPVLKTAEEEGFPVWLEAGNERARDIYAHFGFVVVEVVVVDDVETYCMIKRC